MKPEFEKVRYDLSLIYAQEKLRQALDNGQLRKSSDNLATEICETDFLMTKFAFAFDMYSAVGEDKFYEYFDDAFYEDCTN